MLEAERGNDTPAWKELLCPNKALLHAMAVGWGVALFQQLNGSEVTPPPPPRHQPGAHSLLTWLQLWSCHG